MSPEAAKAYGIIDSVYMPPEKVGAASQGLPAASNPASGTGKGGSAKAADGPAPAGA
jgi:hypothetical protein